MAIAKVDINNGLCVVYMDLKEASKDAGVGVSVLKRKADKGNSFILGSSLYTPSVHVVTSKRGGVRSSAWKKKGA